MKAKPIWCVVNPKGRLHSAWETRSDALFMAKRYAMSVMKFVPVVAAVRGGRGLDEFAPKRKGKRK